MDSDDSETDAMPVDVVFSVQSVVSSEDPPMEEWSSLEILAPEENKKKILYNAGLYDPGSGEVCGEYITMSASSVLRHPYFNYPAIIDPGIEDALLKPMDFITYPDDGQALYLAICKEMNQCPVKSFCRGLLESRIDLRYYCINPNGFRAMAKALQYNTVVQVLNLTDNFLNDDACYHLGAMLLTNNTITELYLRGCRIGPQGAKRLFCNLHRNRTLEVLDLSYNKLGDEAMEYLGKAILFGLKVKNLNLRYNDISGKGVALLEEPFETHNNFTHLDLSWNKIFTTGGYEFLLKLSESICLEVLNLSWNSLSGARISMALHHILLCPRLSELNLSNNKLDGYTLTPIISSLTRAKKLNTLDLSYNPLTPNDAIAILRKVAMVRSKVKNLLMENVAVTEEFLFLLERTKQKIEKKNLVVTYGAIEYVFKAKGPDPRGTVLNRVEYITKKPKKNKVDIALIAMQIQKELSTPILTAKELSGALGRAGAYLDEDLVDELCLVFPGPPQKNAKIKMVNINSMVEYIRRKWPDRELPPTPPPEPEPEPEPPKKKGSGKK